MLQTPSQENGSQYTAQPDMLWFHGKRTANGTLARLVSPVPLSDLPVPVQCVR